MIRVLNVAFRYPSGGFALAVGDLEVAPGESVALVGPSGCGKTTLLHLLGGILAADSGSLLVDGVDLSRLDRDDRQDFRALTVGLVFQEFELLDYLDVFENVLLPYRVSPVLALDASARLRAGRLIEQVGLGGKRHSFPRQLSQGERQRVAVCRSLVTRPKVVLGDEPTANLDTNNRDHVMETLFRYSREQRAPLVVVTHDHELRRRFDGVVDVQELES